MDVWRTNKKPPALNGSPPSHNLNVRRLYDSDSQTSHIPVLLTHFKNVHVPLHLISYFIFMIIKKYYFTFMYLCMYFVMNSGKARVFGWGDIEKK